MPTPQESITQLTELNEELENYFSNTIIPQLFFDNDLRLRKFTPPAMTQFNLSKSDIGKTISDIHDNFRFDSFLENVEHVISKQEILEKEVQTTDKRWYQMNILPYIKRKDNSTNGVIVTFIDITYRIKDLREQEKLISDHETLLDSLSHDIKTPLASMLLAIDEFRNIELKDAPALKNLVDIVDRSVKKMQKLVDELNETREAEHKYRSHMEWLELGHILEDVRLTLSEDIRSSGALLQKNIEVAQIFFSRRQLRSILYNLISNAIKYSIPDGTPIIHVRSYNEDDHVIISLQDNGIGIDKDKQEAIFSKYYRIDNAIEGSGIGLYLVKELVVNAGGRIDIKSTPGEGTLIKIYFKKQD